MAPRGMESLACNRPARAAERLGRTPSAISLQMKRLQDDLGTALFRKRGRGLALTETGELAFSYARRILALHEEFLDTMHGANLAGGLRIGCTRICDGVTARQREVEMPADVSQRSAS
jgi:DNA-binding transcriptional LysR family regulator